MTLLFSSNNVTGTVTSDALTIGNTQLTGNLTISEENGVLTVATDNEKLTENDYDIKWYRDNVEISGQSTKTYTLNKSDDSGKTITAKFIGKGTYTGTLENATGYAVPAKAPEAPKITATAGDQKVTVSWTKPADSEKITGYALAVTTEGAGISGSPFSIDADKTSHEVTGLTNDKEYTFEMIATNFAGDSQKATAKATPVKAQTPDPTPAKKYNITYVLNGGTNNSGNPATCTRDDMIILQAPTRAGYTFDGWYPDKNYKTKVTSIVKGTAGNRVLFAKWIKVTVSRAKTPTLTNLKGGSLKIKYNATAGAKGYQIQYAANSRFKKAATRTTTEKTYTVKKLKKGTTCYVRVSAYKTDSKGDKVYGKWSTVKSRKITR